MAGRAPFVAVRTDVVKDEGFALLGDIAGYNRHEALGRMVALWAFCRDRGLQDAPEDCRGYAVSEALVRRYLGPRGVEAILGDGCAELALGERFGDGLIYLHGTSDDVSRLRDLSRTRQAGGRARANAERDDLGRFGTVTQSDSVIQPTLVQHDSGCASSKPPAGIQQHPPDLQIQIQIRDPDVPDSSGTDVGVEIPEEAWTAADTLRTLVLKAQPTNAIRRAPWGPEQRKGKRRQWADVFRLMFERDERTTQELGEVLRFLFHGQSGEAQFVVQSPTTLREKWDRIVTQMGRPRAPPRSGVIEGIRTIPLL